MAKSDKDNFNFDDFQYSGVKLTPLPDFNQEDDPTINPQAAEPAGTAAVAPAALSEAVAPLEPEDKKAKKKAKKEKPVKAKKPAAAVSTASVDKGQSNFSKQLRETSPFTVLLGMTVVILIVAVIILVVELSRYDFDTKATKGKQTQTTAMNDPIDVRFNGYCMVASERDSIAFSDLA